MTDKIDRYHVINYCQSILNVSSPPNRKKVSFREERKIPKVFGGLCSFLIQNGYTKGHSISPMQHTTKEKVLETPQKKSLHFSRHSHSISFLFFQTLAKLPEKMLHRGHRLRPVGRRLPLRPRLLRQGLRDPGRRLVRALRLEALGEEEAQVEAGAEKNNSCCARQSRDRLFRSAGPESAGCGRRVPRAGVQLYHVRHVQRAHVPRQV